MIGLIFCTGAGEYWLKMFDSFAGTIGLVVIALLEMVAVIYIYGHEKYEQFEFCAFTRRIFLTNLCIFYSSLDSLKIFIK